MQVRSFQRYKINEFVQNDVCENGSHDYIYYIKPYVPFWASQKLSFEIINDLEKIPNQREGIYPRNVLQKLAKTWISDDPIDRSWFDNEDIFNAVKDSLVERLASKYSFLSKRKFSVCFMI